MPAISPQKTEKTGRMHWFLMEMDEGASKGGKNNGKKAYSTVHRIMLVNKNFNLTYNNNKVKFRLKRVIIEGQIISASTNAKFMKHLKPLAKANERATRNKNVLLLQHYNQEYNYMVHAIMPEDEISFPMNEEDCANVIMWDENTARMSNILQYSNSYDLMQNELNSLKSLCFEQAYVHPQNNITTEETEWLLVQYSKSPSHVKYSIINAKDTVLNDLNEYPTVAAYFIQKEIIIQGIIIRISKDRKELEKALFIMKEHCLNAEFPIATSLTPGLKQAE